MKNKLLKIKRKVNRNIFVVNAKFLFQKLFRKINSEKQFHFNKIEKILSAKILFGLDFFIETGTYLGVTINFVKKYFSKIYSIELSEELAAEAKKFFYRKKNITIFCGDSGLLIKDIVEKNKEKNFFG